MTLTTPIKYIKLLLFVATLLAQQNVNSQPSEHFNTGKIIPTNLPLSDGVRHGGMLFLSGQIGVIPGAGKLISGGIKHESKQALDNIKLLLETRGSSMNDIIQCSIYLTDMNDWASFNEIYKGYFLNNYPARTVVGVSQLPLQAKVEVQCVSAAK